MAAFHLFTSLFPFLSSLFLLCLAHAQQQPATVPQPRNPHGLAYQTPMAWSPAAFEFFHPKSSHPPAAAPLPMSSSSLYRGVASTARADQVTGSVWSAPAKHSRVGAGGLVAIVFGLVVMVPVAMGASYVVVKRRANIDRAKTAVQPNA